MVVVGGDGDDDDGDIVALPHGSRMHDFCHGQTTDFSFSENIHLLTKYT